MLKRVLVLLAVLLGAGMIAVPAMAEVPAGLDNASLFADSPNAVIREAYADREQVLPGEEFNLALRFIPFANENFKFHIYSPEPSPDMMYFPTVLMMDPADGVEWGEPVYPPSEDHGDTKWLTGRPVVVVPGKLADDAAPGTRTFTATIAFMACTDEICLSPTEVTAEWTIEVVPADFAGDRFIYDMGTLTADIDPDYSQFSLPEDVAGMADGGQEDGDGVEAGAGASIFENIETEKPEDKPLWLILLLAFIGGLILNVMPCVLPVVSIKVIDLVKNVEKDKSTVIKHGLLFVAGIIATFLAGAGVIAIIQAAGTELGWGSQFQSPGFNLIMAAIIFVFGLSLIDVFKVQAPDTVKSGGGELAKQEGYSGSFFKGVLATVLGTPCVGPFLTPALYIAFSREWYDTLMIFFFVGVGMAIPYLIILPFITRMGRRERGQLSRKIQESKGWLDDFKHFMSFLLFGTAIYLLYILQGVMGGLAVIWALFMLLGLGMAAWAMGRLMNLRKNGLVLGILAAILIAGVTIWVTVPRIYQSTPVASAGVEAVHDGWEPFSRAQLEEYVRDGKTVLVDFTADWCPNCKTNEAVALNIPETQELREELGIIFMVADWTQRDEEIGQTLRALGSASVPLTAIFPGNDPTKPIILDGLFGPALLHEKMHEAVNR